MIKKTIGYIILGLLGGSFLWLWIWLSIDSFKNPSIVGVGIILTNLLGLLYLGFYLVSEDND